MPPCAPPRPQLLCEEYLQQIGQAAASRQLQRRAQLASAFGPDSLLSSSVAPPGGLPPSSSSSSPSSSSPHEGMFAGALANLHHHHHHSQQQQHRAHARQQHAGVAALHAAGGARRAAGEGHAGGSWACGWDAAGALEGMLDEFLDPTVSPGRVARFAAHSRSLLCTLVSLGVAGWREARAVRLAAVALRADPPATCSCRVLWSWRPRTLRCPSSWVTPGCSTPPWWWERRSNACSKVRAGSGWKHKALRAEGKRATG